VSFRLGRIRGGEWIVGGASLLLLICLFGPAWYGFNSVDAPTLQTLGVPVSTTGWQSFDVLNLLILLTAIWGIGVWLLQATMAAPAWPVCATVLDGPLALVTFLGLVYRVLLDPPGQLPYVEAKFGAYAGFALSATILVGLYVSLREDGIAERDAPHNIETLRLAPRRTAPAR
jgi:hypothetical protein